MRRAARSTEGARCGQIRQSIRREGGRTRMRAVVFHEHGGPDVLVVDEIPRPEPRADEVLVEVRACALNHLDVWTREGIPGMTLAFPHVLGNDIAGVVVEVG